MISRLLDRWDNEDREWVLRWRIWVMRWFPYRTAEFKGFDPDTLEMDLGPWKWNKPTVLNRYRKRKP